MLLTLEDIAAMHKCSLRHARDVVVKLPGFPKESPTSTPRNRLWISFEVTEFVTRASWGICAAGSSEHLEAQRQTTQGFRNQLASH